MKTAKYKTNDRVTIVSNSLQPQYEGKVGKRRSMLLSARTMRMNMSSSIALKLTTPF